MRIGIITQPLRTNYGGLLQAYALQTVLEGAGHDVKVLDEPFRKRLPLWKIPFSLVKRSVLRFIFKRDVTIFDEYKYNRTYPVISQYITPFIQQHIHRVEVRCFTLLKAEDFDALIVGSDQVWRPVYNSDIYRSFLNFAENWKVKRIAYAASFGSDNWEYSSDQTMVCGRLLKLFDAVSVREASGVELCKKHWNVDALHLLDPTMLLNVEDYIKLFEEANTPKSSGNLLNYILDYTSEKEIIIQQIANEKGLQPFRVNSKVEDRKAALQDRIQPPVEQWLRGFFDAEFVVTDSFHACVFSILFKKQFVVLGNPRRGMARFESLLSMFGLDDRLITSVEKLNGLKVIDFVEVDEKLNDMRRKAMQFLSSLE